MPGLARFSVINTTKKLLDLPCAERAAASTSTDTSARGTVRGVMSLLKVRSRGYFSKQAKEASEASMYTERSVVRIDSEVQGFCIANPLELRKMGGVERCLNRMVPMPEVVVLNMMVPMVQASMLSREKRVQTANVVSVHSLSAEAASRLRAGTE